MKKEFKPLAEYIRLFDGMGKPKLDFQKMYKLFPKLNFTGSNKFGSYENFGKAFEQKIYDMIVTDGQNECYMVYREYQDANENLAYVS